MHLLVYELYRYQNARYNDNKFLAYFDIVHSVQYSIVHSVQYSIVHSVQHSIRLIIKNQQSMIHCALHVWRVASHVTNVRFFFLLSCSYCAY